MVYRCSVVSCENKERKTKIDGKQVRFFSFPKDPKLSKTWIQLCGRRKGSLDVSRARICGVHFEPEDFEDNISAKIRGILPKQLKKDAVPTLFLGKSSSCPIESERSKRVLQRKRKALVDELLNSLPKDVVSEEDSSKEVELQELLSPEVVSKKVVLKEGVSKKVLSKEVVKEQPIQIFYPSPKPIKTTERILLEQTQETDCNKLWLKIRALEKENATLRQVNEFLERKIQEIEQNQEEEDAYFEERLNLALKYVITPSETEKILNLQPKARWTTEELARALTLRYFSRLKAAQRKTVSDAEKCKRVRYNL